MRWGLSADADLVYRALHCIGRSSTRHLALDLGMSVARVGHAIDELHAHAAIRQAERVAREDLEWQAHGIGATLAALRRKRFPQTDEWTRIRRFIGATSQLELPEHPEAQGGFRRLDLAQTRARIRDLVAVERYEHLAMQPEEVFSAEVAAAALPLDKQLVDKGVRMRVLGRPPADGDAQCAASDALASVGGDYRESADIPLKMMIFDRRVVLVPAGPVPADGVLEISDPTAVAAAVAMFGRDWLRALDPRKKGVRPVMLSPRERSVIEALAQGMTDEQVGKELRISTRSVSYAVSGLMDRLQVDNRFQLGLLLGAAGAAPLPDQPEDPATLAGADQPNPNGQS